MTDVPARPPFIIVSGLARCGTTLTMHMLYDAGIPCIGARPSFEVEELNHRSPDPAFLAKHCGSAFKLLDPHMAPLPCGLDAIVIWLDRDTKEQANSQAKFVEMMAGVPPVSHRHRRQWAAALRSERPKALAMFGRRPKLVLSFEDIIGEPRRASRQITAFLAPWWPGLDLERMAARVRPRSPQCAPSLEIELALADEAERVRGAGS